MRKTIFSILTICLALTLSTGCKQSQEKVLVDEPSVKLEAELNLHYKTFSEIELTEKYMDRWLYKYNYLPGAKVMSDQELFSNINLDLANLAAVRTAVQNNDWENAVSSLAEYFKNRPAPCYIDPGPLSPSNKQKALEIADECLANPDFPDITWPREKFGRGSKDSRWNWVSYLYTAYRYTEEMKYLKGTMDMFAFWYETVRPPAGAPNIWLTPSFIDNPWGSHLVSYRLRTLALLNNILGKVEFDEISADKRKLLYKSAIEHARFLVAVNPGYRSGNIQIHQMRNLLEAGVNFSEFKESWQWINFGWENLLKHVWLDLMPDGGFYERAMAYNNAVVRFWQQILELSHTAGLKTPTWLKPKLKKAQEWTIKVYTPTLNMAPIGDSIMGEENFALLYLIDGALLFPCPEFKFFVRNYPNKINQRAKELFREEAPKALAKLEAIEPKEPAYTSVLLKDTEWAVMRSGWDREARYLIFDYGSNEPWHCHRDGLGFSIFAYGKPLITDCGHSGTYLSDRSKTWYKETISNNTVLINGMSQQKFTTGTCDRWVSAASGDYIDAEHDGYKYLGAYCRRKITFVKPDYWIITDNITEKMCQTSGYQECEWLAHFQPTELTIDEKLKTVHTNNSDVNSLLIPSHPENLKVSQSKGWAVTPAGEVNDAPYISYTREGDLPIDYEVVAYPYKGTSVPEITVEQLDMGEDSRRCKGLKITTPKGTDYYLEALKGDYYFVIDEKTNFRNYGEFSFDGEMALIREKDGRLSSILLVGGTCLKRNGVPLAKCSGKIDWAEIQFSEKSVSIDGTFSGRIKVTPNMD